MTAEKIIQTMRDWIGTDKRKIIDIYNAHKPLAHNYAVKYTDAWCDTTVSACFIKNDAVSLIGGTECGVERHVKIFKDAGIWQEDGTVVPKPGWVIVYNWDDSTQPNDGYSDHIGIVEKIDGKQITVIEGNYNNAVRRRTIPVGWGYIRGYAMPKYDNEEKTKKEEQRIVVDVSEHNGTIDWQKAKTSVYGAIIRLGYGQNVEYQDDKLFLYNVKCCERYGIPYSFYIYSYAYSEGESAGEVDHALRLAKGYKPGAIFFDTEQPGTQVHSKANAELFVKLIRKAGYKAGVYAYDSWYKSYLKGIDCDYLWIAKWGANDGKVHDKPEYDCDIWQYTSKGSINGSTHRADLSIMYRNVLSDESKPKEGTTVLELVARVQEGKYGNGDERVKALGASYQAVQEMINHIYRSSANALAKDVITGMFGNGELRKRVLGSRYSEVQNEVNKMLR